ncbi:MAG: NAD(P)/FAD-dependent oxidoreductase [Granulosicoccus sp.]
MIPNNKQPIPHPSSTGVVIIGGGVAGVSAALFLAEAGVPCVLFEKGCIAGEQSSRNWGWIRQQGRDLAELPLMMESARLWQRVAAEVDEDIGYRKGGCTYLAGNDSEFENYAQWLQSAQALGVDSHMLDIQQTRQKLDHGGARFVGAMHTPSDAYAEPSLAVPAMARLAKHKGATIIENTAVRTLIRKAGHVCGVVTEQGSIQADGVILAGGIWSRGLLENEGVSFPQLAVKCSVLSTTAAPQFSTSTFGAADAAIRPRMDGGYTVARSGAAGFEIIPASIRHLGAFLPLLKDNWRIMKISLGSSFFGPLGYQRWNADQPSPFEWVRTMDPTADKTLLDTVMQSARELYPQLSQCRVAQTWAGLIDVMPDEVCTVGALPELPGLVIATGMSGHGFGLGPGVGMLATQLICGESPLVNPEKLATSRFRR